MKILSAAQSRQADEATIVKQGITSLDLMERAGAEVYLWLKGRFTDKETIFHVYCGKGNNGGDGLVVARLLANDKYTVILDIIGDGNTTADFSESLQKVNDAGIEYNIIPVPEYKKGKTVIVDALFGIGLSRELGEEYRSVINTINSSSACVVSIDVPSGMFMDRPTNFAVKADIVLTFQHPKLAFYMPGNYEYSNELAILNIGLDNDFLSGAQTNYMLTDSTAAYKCYRPVHRFAHKGTQGHALIIGGSYGKIGAVCLSARAALKAGSGLVTAYLPECGYTVVQTALPEAMALTNGERYIEQISYNIQPSAIGIGMGLGQEPETQAALYDFLKNNTMPLVVDADALNILAGNKEWLQLLPEDTILTPHPKELERLIGNYDNDFERLEQMKAFSACHNIVLVAKDAHTMVIHHDNVYINSTGNSALATAGSGDVLTGIITGLLAQGYTAINAAVFGVYLHGLTADIAVPETGKQAFTASTIPDYMGKAFLKVESECR